MDQTRWGMRSSILSWSEPKCKAESANLFPIDNNIAKEKALQAVFCSFGRIEFDGYYDNIFSTS